jgi:hypothetical protein
MSVQALQDRQKQTDSPACKHAASEPHLRKQARKEEAVGRVRDIDGSWMSRRRERLQAQRVVPDDAGDGRRQQLLPQLRRRGALQPDEK